MKSNATRMVEIKISPNAFLERSERLRLKMIRGEGDVPIEEINDLICDIQDKVGDAAMKKKIKITAKLSEDSPADY